MKTNIHFLLYLAQFVLEWEMFQARFVEKNQNTFYVHSLFYENSAVYEMWKKCCTARQTTEDNITQHIRLECWIHKATHTHTLRICNTYCFSTATIVERTRLIVMSIVIVPLLFIVFYSSLYEVWKLEWAMSRGQRVFTINYIIVQLACDLIGPNMILLLFTSCSRTIMYSFSSLCK